MTTTQTNDSIRLGESDRPSLPEVDHDWLARELIAGELHIVGSDTRAGLIQSWVSVHTPIGLPISVIQEDATSFIAQDILEIAYGQGATYDEAVSDLLAVVRERISMLRDSANRLSPRLRTQLISLERLFPQL